MEKQDKAGAEKPDGKADHEIETEDETAAGIEAVENLPKPVKKKVEYFEMMAAGISPVSPFAGKLSEKHIDKILEIQSKQIEYTHETEKQARNHFLVIYLATAALFLTIILSLAILGKDSLLLDIIKIVSAFACGFAGGMGLKAHINRKK
ncbi:MAG: hypothetical protein AB1523_13580 [Bacillota bacterium]